MSLNPKLFGGLPPPPPSNPRLGVPPPPPPRPKFNPAMIQVPPQPTFTDVMIALDTVNKNIEQLSTKLDYEFTAQQQIAVTLHQQTMDYLNSIYGFHANALTNVLNAVGGRG